MLTIAYHNHILSDEDSASESDAKNNSIILTLVAKTLCSNREEDNSLMLIRFKTVLAGF